MDEDQGGDHRQPDVSATDQVDEPPPEASLDEREEGDAEDEHADQVLPLEDGYRDEAYEHKADAGRGPGLGHAADPELVFGGRPVGTGDVRARGVKIGRAPCRERV